VVEGENDIDCSIQDVQHALENPGEHFVGVVGLMPGMTSVELVEQGPDFVAIRTNEGLMKRTNISKRIEGERRVDGVRREYQAGSAVTTTSHFSDEFSANGTGVTHRVVMSDVDAPGFLGFFYRTFGRSKTGNAFLTAYKAYFEKQRD
jgi:hypothetical protein